MNAPPRQALRFVGQAAVLAYKHGLKRGLGKAAAKANPTMMAYEAAYSVLDAVGSYLELREARVVRDGLRKEMASIDERLRLERLALFESLRMAEEQSAQAQEERQILAQIAVDCNAVVSKTLHALNEASSEDLPDLDAIDEIALQLTRSYHQLQDALALYQSPAPPQPLSPEPHEEQD